MPVKHIFTYDRDGQANMLTNPSDELNGIIQLMSGLLLMSPVASGKTSVVERGYEDWIIKNTGNFYIICVVDHCEKSQLSQLMQLVEENLSLKENNDLAKKINNALIALPKPMDEKPVVIKSDLTLPPATPQKTKEELQMQFVKADQQLNSSFADRLLSLFRTPKKTPLTENNEQKTPATILLTPMTKGSTGQRPKLPEDYVGKVLFQDEEPTQEKASSITATM